MFFCQKCGKQLQDGINACPNCNTFINNPAPNNNAFIPNNNIMEGTTYVKAKIPGRSLSISGMVLSIIGLVIAFSSLIGTIKVLENLFVVFNNNYPPFLLICSIPSILGVSLSCAGRVKRYRTGMSMSGIIMGVIGMVLSIICLLSYITT